MHTITFKISDELFAKLDAQARQHNAKSTHKWARHIVTDYLNDTRHAVLLSHVADLRKQVIRLREGCATAVSALLSHDRKWDRDQAQAWAAKTFSSL